MRPSEASAPSIELVAAASPIRHHPGVTWELRRIQPGEGPQLREIRLRALADAPSAFASTYEEEVGRPASWWEEAAASRAAGSLAATFVTAAHGAWGGLVGAFRTPERHEHVHLVSLWVAPEHRRVGVGRLLVEEVLAWAGSTAGEVVELWVNERNQSAIGLYTRAGFVATGDRQPMPSHPSHEEQRMTLRLGLP